MPSTMDIIRPCLGCVPRNPEKSTLLTGPTLQPCMRWYEVGLVLSVLFVATFVQMLPSTSVIAAELTVIAQYEAHTVFDTLSTFLVVGPLLAPVCGWIVDHRVSYRTALIAYTATLLLTALITDVSTRLSGDAGVNMFCLGVALSTVVAIGFGVTVVLSLVAIYSAINPQQRMWYAAMYGCVFAIGALSCALATNFFTPTSESHLFWDVGCVLPLIFLLMVIFVIPSAHLDIPLLLESTTGCAPLSPPPLWGAELSTRAMRWLVGGVYRAYRLLCLATFVFFTTFGGTMITSAYYFEDVTDSGYGTGSMALFQKWLMAAAFVALGTNFVVPLLSSWIGAGKLVSYSCASSAVCLLVIPHMTSTVAYGVLGQVLYGGIVQVAFVSSLGFVTESLPDLDNVARDMGGFCLAMNLGLLVGIKLTAMLLPVVGSTGDPAGEYREKYTTDGYQYIYAGFALLAVFSSGCFWCAAEMLRRVRAEGMEASSASAKRTSAPPKAV